MAERMLSKALAATTLPLERMRKINNKRLAAKQNVD